MKAREDRKNGNASVTCGRRNNIGGGGAVVTPCDPPHTPAHQQLSEHRHFLGKLVTTDQLWDIFKDCLQGT